MFYHNYRPIRFMSGVVELVVLYTFTLSVVGTTPLIEFGNESIDLSVKTGPEPEPGAHQTPLSKLPQLISCPVTIA